MNGTTSPGDPTALQMDQLHRRLEGIPQLTFEEQLLQESGLFVFTTDQE